MSEESIASFKYEAYRYLGDEIFSALSEPEKRFLLESSILDVIDPLSIKELFSPTDANNILKALARRNLFIQTIFDPKRGYLYRYHQIFRDFLRDRFATEFSTKDQAHFLLKAGSLYERNASFENALKFYLQAKSFHSVAGILERIGMDLIDNGRTGDLADWLQQIPAELIPERPWLRFFFVHDKALHDRNDQRP